MHATGVKAPASHRSETRQPTFATRLNQSIFKDVMKCAGRNPGQGTKAIRTGSVGEVARGLKWRPEDEDPGDFHFGSQLPRPGAHKSIAGTEPSELTNTVPDRKEVRWRLVSTRSSAHRQTGHSHPLFYSWRSRDSIIPKRDETGLIRDGP